MALKHQPDLILNYITVIFDLKDKEQLRSAVVYFLAVIERSPREFMEELKNIEFTTKAETMSTLEMLLEQGRQEGLEIGIQKGIKEGIEKGTERGEIIANVLMLLRISLRFSNLTPLELSDLTKLSFDDVQGFTEAKRIKNKAVIEEVIKTQLLRGIKIKNEEWAEFTELLEQI
ncbi:MAG: hypothetical protein MI974_24800 [Chitinophagales bacterium]|nr:hypothetical protein [Chitinophagales bacterium]